MKHFQFWIISICLQSLKYILKKKSWCSFCTNGFQLLYRIKMSPLLVSLSKTDHFAGGNVTFEIYHPFPGSCLICRDLNQFSVDIMISSTHWPDSPLRLESGKVWGFSELAIFQIRICQLKELLNRSVKMKMSFVIWFELWKCISGLLLPTGVALV